MAKKRKYPKEPKRSASLETWRNYRDKVKEVDKYNAELEKRKRERKSYRGCETIKKTLKF